MTFSIDAKQTRRDLVLSQLKPMFFVKNWNKIGKFLKLFGKLDEIKRQGALY
jgi:hypothetical protein